MATVYTIGHGTRSLEELVRILREAGAGKVTDVRRFPGSRRSPHLARAALDASLPGLGVGYEWRGEELGGRRSGASSASRHTALRNRSFQSYAEHMGSEAFRGALERVIAEANEGERVALMCAETLWWRCHRKLIADALVLRDVEVIHLLREGEQRSHRLSEAVRAGGDGLPVYDVGETAPLL